MPEQNTYSRNDLIAAWRQDHPELKKAPDNEVFAAIAVDHPDLAKGISELQPPAPKTSAEDVYGPLLGGVGPTELGHRIMGALASVINPLFPAGDVKQPNLQQPAMTPSEDIGAKTATIGAVAPLVQSAGTAAVNGIKSLVPTTESAGQKFEQVAAAANNVPLDTSAAQDAVTRAQELRQRGSSMPKVLNDFIKSQKAAEDAPMTYQAGRDFASNSSALSAREATAMNAKMQRQVAEFAGAMRDANREAAVKVGMGDLYDAAMKEYRQAKNLQQAGDVLKKWGVRALIAAGLGSAGAAGVRLYNELTK